MAYALPSMANVSTSSAPQSSAKPPVSSLAAPAAASIGGIEPTTMSFAPPSDPSDPGAGRLRSTALPAAASTIGLPDRAPAPA